MTVLIGAAFAVLAAVLAQVIVANARVQRTISPGGTGDCTLHEVAFLSGGPERVGETVICAMREKERIAVEGGAVRVQRPVADDEFERELLSLCGDWEAPLSTVRAGLARSAPVQRVGDALAARGLLWLPGLYRPWRRAASRNAAVGSVVFLLATALLLWSDAPPLAAGALMGAAALTLTVGAALAPGRGGRLTDSGRGTLGRLRRRGAAAAEAPVAMAFALGGAAVLTDVVLRDQLTAAAPSAAAAASSPGGVGWVGCGAASDGGDPGEEDGGGSGGGGSGGGGGGCGGDGGGGCGGGGCGGCGGG
ncbi:TIGR04222 domain-containing membrane protein [Streptomyces sp. SBT349]|uniref:TIGR04222 domain-containing membrane protein n=1 Tax=Streptomyces sp. SBT349 TaxID=1580539 RepID=UPI00066CB72E|nr:TIGR04222 domain-containing membrane protein [Streptomyces sp. SBT349]